MRIPSNFFHYISGTCNYIDFIYRLSDLGMNVYYSSLRKDIDRLCSLLIDPGDPKNVNILMFNMLLEDARIRKAQGVFEFGNAAAVIQWFVRIGEEMDRMELNFAQTF